MDVLKCTNRTKSPIDFLRKANEISCGIRKRVESKFDFTGMPTNQNKLRENRSKAKLIPKFDCVLLIYVAIIVMLLVLLLSFS